ncbi:MAG: phospho-N-acetylmuramoyl-pentapeptide-transferase [Lachnospiraceae bacterium]|nr:phospho-N-acetylmuramoyl-pentapeptide-transferase [Lachnospiraceae bacterium]
MTQNIILPGVLAFAVSAALGPVLIPVLHKLKFGQNIRDDGPQSHLKKQGTPTMGGIMFLAGIIVAGAVFAIWNPRIWPVLFMTAGFGVVGFIDDYRKVVKHRSEGLTPKEKLVFQFVLTALFTAYLVRYVGTESLFPFFGMVKLPVWIYVPFVFFVIMGTDNGTNLTDGLDGLCSSVTVVVALFLAFISAQRGEGIEPICAAVAGGLMGFLLFNAYPAKVFMGDTGALGLGGFVAAAALMMKMPFFILFFGIIYLAEVVSDLLQFAYFRKTHGKRLFRMAPIHHHFELGGWSETRVVTVFTIVTVLGCCAAYMLM